MPEEDLLDYVNDMASQLADLCRADFPDIAALLEAVVREASANGIRCRLAPAQIARRAA